MKYHVTIDGHDHVVAIDGSTVTLDGEPVVVRMDRVEGNSTHGQAVMFLDDAAHGLSYALPSPGGNGSAHVGSAWTLALGGAPIQAEVLDNRQREIQELVGAAAADAGPKPIRAPMPGMVVKIEVRVGERVDAGQGVVVVEAMKMENELQAEIAATVSAVHAVAGEPVDKDQILVEFAADEPTSPNESDE